MTEPQPCHSCGRTDEPLDPFSKRCVNCLIEAARAKKHPPDPKMRQAGDK